MKRKQRSTEQIISILKEHEAGLPATEIVRKHGISNGTSLCVNLASYTSRMR